MLNRRAVFRVPSEERRPAAFRDARQRNFSGLCSVRVAVSADEDLRRDHPSKAIEEGRPGQLEFGGRTSTWQNRQGAHEERELQRIYPPREQGEPAIRNQERQDLPRDKASALRRIRQ